MAKEGFRGARMRIQRLLDMRYLGQAYELTVPGSGSFIAAFHKAHDRRYGYSDVNRPVEVVNIRVRVAGVTPKPEINRLPAAGRAQSAVVTEVRRALFGGKAYSARVYDRAGLQPETALHGPAIVTEYSATAVIPPGWRGTVDSWGNLILAKAGRI